MNSKRLNNLKLAIIALVSFVTINNINGQASTTVTSTTGYSVNITLDVVRINAPNSCKWGYNFNTRISYDIQYSGSSIPRNLYTLQTTLACGSYNNFTSLPTNARNTSGQRNTNSNPWNPSNDCATATPTSLGCNTFALVIEGPGITRRTINMALTTALPVELIEFNAYPEDLHIKLDWSTAAELNNSHFEVERSTDGINWSKIAKVDASTESATINNYSYNDQSAASGINYYRLKQVDKDGKTTVYNTLVAVMNNTVNFQVYPNPATTQFTISGENIESANVQIIDAMGKSVEIAGTIESGKITYNTESLNNGIYFVNVIVGNDIKTHKITINK